MKDSTHKTNVQQKKCTVMIFCPDISASTLEQFRNDGQASAGARPVKKVLDSVKFDRGRTLVRRREVRQRMLKSGVRLVLVVIDKLVQAVNHLQNNNKQFNACAMSSVWQVTLFPEIPDPVTFGISIFKQNNQEIVSPEEPQPNFCLLLLLLFYLKFFLQMFIPHELLKIQKFILKWHFKKLITFFQF